MYGLITFYVEVKIYLINFAGGKWSYGAEQCGDEFPTNCPIGQGNGQQ